MALRLRPRASAALVVAFAVCTVIGVVGCSHSSAAIKPANTPAVSIDDMIVSLQDVRRIADADSLSPHAKWDLHKPPPADANAPVACRAVGHNELTFGSNWSEFRSAGYHGVTDDIEPGGNDMINGVTQAVARYPNPDAALTVFHQLETSLQMCAALHDPDYGFTLDKPDPMTLRITAQQWCHLYREKSAMLISIGVVGLQSADQIANTVIQMITDRIT